MEAMGSLPSYTTISKNVQQSNYGHGSCFQAEQQDHFKPCGNVNMNPTLENPRGMTFTLEGNTLPHLSHTPVIQALIINSILVICTIVPTKKIVSLVNPVN